MRLWCAPPCWHCRNALDRHSPLLIRRPLHVAPRPDRSPSPRHVGEVGRALHSGPAALLWDPNRKRLGAARRTASRRLSRALRRAHTSTPLLALEPPSILAELSSSPEPPNRSGTPSSFAPKIFVVGNNPCKRWRPVTCPQHPICLPSACEKPARSTLFVN